jgi:N-acetylglucosaminyldiphosphoundecaprenol N-acetyl-beta-D-mannosaminyltransferase
VTAVDSPADSFPVLGVQVNAVQIPDAVQRMGEWIDAREGSHYVAVTGMHGVSESSLDPGFRTILNTAGMVVPDGMPLVWLGRLHGHGLRRRVYGPELMIEFCRATSSRGRRHYFYGGAAGVADALAAQMAERFPGLIVAGTCSPPFRPLTSDEDAAIVAQINTSRADIVWVGLSTPKQERWMHAHRALLDVPVMVGVGAAFDIHSGRLKQAPVWMREHGLEWLYRLVQEPRRLWRRYVVLGSLFVCNVSLELAGLRRFDSHVPPLSRGLRRRDPDGPLSQCLRSARDVRRRSRESSGGDLQEVDRGQAVGQTRDRNQR